MTNDRITDIISTAIGDFYGSCYDDDGREMLPWPPELARSILAALEDHRMMVVELPCDCSCVLCVTAVLGRPGVYEHCRECERAEKKT